MLLNLSTNLYENSSETFQSSKVEWFKALKIVQYYAIACCIYYTQMYNTASVLLEWCNGMNKLFGIQRIASTFVKIDVYSLYVNVWSCITRM